MRVLLEVLERAADRVDAALRALRAVRWVRVSASRSGLADRAKQRELQDNLERIAQTTPDEWFEPMRGPVLELSAACATGREVRGEERRACSWAFASGSRRTSRS